MTNILLKYFKINFKSHKAGTRGKIKLKLKHTKLYEWGKKSKPGQQHYLILRIKKIYIYNIQYF